MAVILLSLAIVLLVIAEAITMVVLLKARISMVRLQSEAQVLQARLADQEKLEHEMRSAARAEFENLANRVIERETRLFKETSEKGLERLLEPLKERLQSFEKRVEESYQSEGRERHVLKNEVERLIALNERMAQEAGQLASALRGDNKVQGDWGELVLEHILQASGLREGIEYTKQDSLIGTDGDRFRPDIIIRLPDEKQIVIDAKVSLTAYESHMRSDSEEARQGFLIAHLESIERHVEQLAEKHYPKLKGLRTPEFVFLFTPIEPAYLLAMRHDPDLATRAWRKGVAIVTSTTLFTSLKTVASIWRLEHQNRNALEIAQEAARLYDKFVGFHDDFEKIGRTFETGVQQYEEARRKLRDGQGNVFRKIELLRELGASPSKRIRPDLLEEQ